ncbi:MAG: PaaI family thioesterase [Thermomicrobiales bacterium]
MGDSQLVFDRSAPLAVRQDHNCFGCGGLNAHGLHLRFFQNPDGSVWADWTPPPMAEGWQGIVHGGIITTVLDEVMGWVLSAHRIWAVTARLNVSFRKPVEIDIPVKARAWIVEDHGRRISVGAAMTRDADKVVLAEADGMFVRVSSDMAAAWESRYLDQKEQHEH